MFQVYLIDDEAWALISLEKLIPWEEYGFCICGKSNSAKAAWEEISKNPPDVIITDIRMPGMSGLELLKKLHDEKMKTQVVLVSGFAEFQYAQEAIKHGAFEYLLKQVKREQLKDCMVRLADFLSRQKEKQLETEAYNEKKFWTQMQYKQAKEAAEALFQPSAEEWTGNLCFVAACKRNTKQHVEQEREKNMQNSSTFCSFRLGSRGENEYVLCIANGNGAPDDEAAKDLFQKQIIEQNQSWGISRVSDGTQKISEMIWEADTALRTAEFSQKQLFIYHIKGTGWEKWDEMSRAMHYRQNVQVRTQLEALKSDVESGSVLSDELFSILERMDYEYKKIEGKNLKPQEWIRETDMLRAYPESSGFFKWLAGFFPVLSESGSDSAQYIIQIIEKQMAKAPTLATIGKELGMSQGALTQILKRQTGKNYSELLLEQRMERARELLVYTDKTITEIAEETGYTDLFYFSKTFKKNNGVSPNEYRKERKNG
jgi:two-component system, response regulator YesN